MSFKAELLKIPPVTRFLCASSLAVTLPIMLRLLSPYWVVFTIDFVLRQWQIWRPFTSFFLGSSGINFIFDFVMLYRTSDSLESTSFTRRSADYAWQLLVAAGAILTLSTPLRTVVHTRPLLLCLTYLSSALAPPGAQSSLLGLITIPVAYLPYILVGMDLIMGGPGAAGSAVVGCVVGHLWWWGVFGQTGTTGALAGWGRAPAWMKRLVGDGAADGVGPGTGAERDRNGQGESVGGGVHVLQPRTRAGQSGSSTTSGYQWGSGNRLGSG